MVNNPYERNLFGVGYIGEGEFKVSLKRVYSPHYIYWMTMLKRCYSEKFQETSKTYMGCSVADEWHNFQNFAKWWEENFYEIDNETMHLDKDILVKGNKIYSPETCVFVPHTINTLFVKSDVARGKYPIGVCFVKGNKTKKFKAQCSAGKREIKFLGRFSTPEEAFYAYKTFKENVIKQIADEYIDKIPNKLYNAMINYKVEITD